MNMTNEYITTGDIAKIFKINVLTVRRWIKSGKLPAIFLGKEYRVKKSDFDSFIQKRRVGKDGGRR